MLQMDAESSMVPQIIGLDGKNIVDCFEASGVTFIIDFKKINVSRSSQRNSQHFDRVKTTNPYLPVRSKKRNNGHSIPQSPPPSTTCPPPAHQPPSAEVIPDEPQTRSRSSSSATQEAGRGFQGDVSRVQSRSVGRLHALTRSSRCRLTGFLLGSVIAGSGLYYYMVDEYKVSNELLTEDIYVSGSGYFEFVLCR